MSTDGYQNFDPLAYMGIPVKSGYPISPLESIASQGFPITTRDSTISALTVSHRRRCSSSCPRLPRIICSGRSHVAQQGSMRLSNPFLRWIPDKPKRGSWQMKWRWNLAQIWSVKNMKEPHLIALKSTWSSLFVFDLLWISWFTWNPSMQFSWQGSHWSRRGKAVWGCNCHWIGVVGKHGWEPLVWIGMVQVCVPLGIGVG